MCFVPANNDIIYALALAVHRMIDWFAFAATTATTCCCCQSRGRVGRRRQRRRRQLVIAAAVVGRGGCGHAVYGRIGVPEAQTPELQNAPAPRIGAVVGVELRLMRAVRERVVVVAVVVGIVGQALVAAARQGGVVAPEHIDYVPVGYGHQDERYYKQQQHYAQLVYLGVVLRPVVGTIHVNVVILLVQWTQC